MAMGMANGMLKNSEIPIAAFSFYVLLCCFWILNFFLNEIKINLITAKTNVNVKSNINLMKKSCMRNGMNIADDIVTKMQK